MPPSDLRPIAPRQPCSSRRLLAVLLACGLAGAQPEAQAEAQNQTQTWQYKSYKKSGLGGTYSRENFNLGTLTLDEKDGRASVRLIAGAVDACLRGEVPAEVTRDAGTTLIELKFSLAGCEPVRYVIRNDGSGGRREHQRGGRWADDSFDHGLTPVRP